MKLTNLCTLIKVINNKFACRDQRRIQFLLFFTIGSDRGNESARRDVFSAKKTLSRGRARDANVAGLYRLR